MSGHSIELYPEFTRTGCTCVHFPHPVAHRINVSKRTCPKHHLIAMSSTENR
jgi:hypothetical protein